MWSLLNNIRNEVSVLIEEVERMIREELKAEEEKVNNTKGVGCNEDEGRADGIGEREGLGVSSG